jgi:hypothetical protein
MPIDSGRLQTLSKSIASRPWPLICALGVFCGLMATVIGTLSSGGLRVDDDAYYYLIIAKNLAASGVSTFDQQSLTNGYHPLWLVLLTLQDLTVGPSLLVTLTIEAMLFAGAVYLFLSPSDEAPAYLQASFAISFLVLIGHFGMDGMEVALLIFCTGLFARSLFWAQSGGAVRGLWVGLAAAACVGARIDSAVFIVVAVAVAPLSRSARMIAFALLAVLGAIYAGYNLWVFGMAMPVSSTIKSLGGLQINHRLLAQLGFGSEARDHPLMLRATVGLLLVSPGLIALSRPGTIGRAFAVAASLGGLIYLTRLIFFSSWIVWPWYNFALLFPLLAALYVLPPHLAPMAASISSRFSPERGRIGAIAATVAGFAAIVVLYAALAATAPVTPRGNFATINRIAVQRYSGLLGGARVAMGDRAGSFAAAYPGPVTQLEGLVNDRAYLQALKSSGTDVRALLCGRGVRFVLSYQRDLGAYARLNIPVLRPFLTQYRAPGVEVWRTDEVGQVKDLAIYDNRVDQDVGDNTLYIWRLRC